MYKHCLLLPLLFQITIPLIPPLSEKKTQQEATKKKKKNPQQTKTKQHQQ